MLIGGRKVIEGMAIACMVAQVKNSSWHRRDWHRHDWPMHHARHLDSVIVDGASSYIVLEARSTRGRPQESRDDDCLDVNHEALSPDPVRAHVRHHHHNSSPDDELSGNCDHQVACCGVKYT